MKFLERDLEEIIMNASEDDLQKRGLSSMYGFKRNQVRIGNYGISDIITYYRESNFNEVLDKFALEDHYKLITIYELKKDNISISSLAQACVYLKGVKDYLRSTGRDVESYHFKIVLIGRKVDMNSAIIYIPDIFNSDNISVSNYEYSYDVDGLKFKEMKNYGLINKGFKK